MILAFDRFALQDAVWRYGQGLTTILPPVSQSEATASQPGNAEREQSIGTPPWIAEPSAVTPEA